MTDAQGAARDEDDIVAAYGEDFAEEEPFGTARPKRTRFAPWHHPVKQRVRTSQWQELVRRLISARNMNGGVLRYFTLPGPDLLDVRVLAEICAPRNVAIEYFGFDAAMQASQITTPRFEIESALRQSRRITDDAVISPDQLQDIAISDSQAAKQLSLRRPFDVINIDACDHLAYRPDNRQSTTFDALQSLLAHQMDATAPWLLFVTTRAEPALMAGPGEVLQTAVNDNLNSAVAGFRPALAQLFEEDSEAIDGILAQIWAVTDVRFLKLYAVGLAKFLLQFFLAQPNRPANVELASTCTYRVYGDNPDMLALAFRITPARRVVFQPGQQPQPTAALEVERAVVAAGRAQRLRDLDDELEQNPALCLEAAQQSAALLAASNYDIDAYAKWLTNHEQRPVAIDRSALT
jgi:hypothetical protein